MKLIFVLRPYKPTEALYGIPPSCWRKSKNCCSLHNVITHVFTHILHRKHMILPNVRTLIRPQSSQKDMACWLLTSSGQENAACTDVDRHGTHEEQLRSPVSLSPCPPTPTADRALSYSIWQHCLIPVYSTRDTESWGHARRNLIGEGMRLYLLCDCAVLLATCELNPHTAAKPQVER